jgi:ParB-like nuclease family protein
MGVIEAERARVEVVGEEPESREENTATEHALLEQVPAVRVAIGSLVVTDSPRLSGENLEHIHALANAQGKLPPIIVHRASMRVLDGLHRLRAAKFRGHSEIEVQFFDGDDADAFVVAVRSNIAHGLPLSLADRKAAATRIITSHPQWSDRLIASVTGLAAGTIAELRRKSEDEVPSADIRIGLDGRARPVNSAERRRTASELLIDDPSLSLRQVARIAGISPETARDVRSRLHDGSESIPPERGRLPQVDHDTHEKKRQGHTDRAALGNFHQVVRQLKSDPTLRFTETGRTLLRLLDVHAISSARWAELCDNVPAHCKGTIANVALGCAEVWRSFSERLAEQDTCNGQNYQAVHQR